MSDDSFDEKPGVTRRVLMRGALVGRVAAGVGGKDAAAPPAALGPAPVPLEQSTNGTQHALTAQPRGLLPSARRKSRIGNRKSLSVPSSIPVYRFPIPGSGRTIGSTRLSATSPSSRRREMSKEKLRLGIAGHFEEKEVEIAAGDPIPWDPSTKFSILGKRTARLDATGR